MDFTIRTAEPEEYEELGEITAQAYLGDGVLDFGADDPYLPRLRDVAGRAAAAEVLTAVDTDGTLLGGVTFVGSGGPWADMAGEGETEFRMLAVARAGRRRGVGEALVRACLARARETDGCVRIVLSTQSGMHAAHRIYERLGFVRSPERDWEPRPGIALMAYAMDLPIDG
jgi:ribosomal protein S18 acetylase RimI-like enzyme